jgi:C4-dicarboxylate-binding protein DctP
MMLARFAVGLLLCVLALPLAGPLGAAEPIVIKFSHVVAPDTPKGKAAERFKKLAEARTGGRVKVEVYPNSALYKDTEELAALKRGDVQIIAPSISRLAQLGDHELEVFDLPYLFQDYAAVHRVTEGRVGHRLLTHLARYGIEGLDYLDNGFKIMSADRPLHEPADYKGLKMRVQPTAVIAAEMRALGATPVLLAFAQTYAAMKDGSVDGSENTPSNFYTQHFNEVQPNLSLTNHGYLGYAVVVNKAFWDKLPADIRAALNQAMEEATAYGDESAAEDNRLALDRIRAAGTTLVYQPTTAELAALKAQLLPVHKEMAGLIGAKTLEAVYEAAGFQP